MSRSPEAAPHIAPIQDYVNGWQAVTKMLREGRSLSGRERNCCFLNTGQQRFADISGTTGFDFPDDARGLALVDWDFDGDLDLWVTNQTAPRLRYLRNDASHAGKSIAFRLQGTSCNRDAIGARVLLQMGPLPDDSENQRSQTMIRTLHAGQGFLSQSSKWLHFGLGDAQQAARVKVRWPGGDEEEFGAVTAGGHYRLEQGRGVAIAISVPKPVTALQAGEIKSANDSPAARVVEPGRPDVPDVSYIGTDGKLVSISAPGKQPLLVILWASWCRPCVQELQEFSAHASDFAGAGLELLVVNVESLDGLPLAQADKALPALDIPFARGHATPPLATALDTLQRAIVDKSRPLGLPASFLLDSRRRLVVMYLGEVSPKQVLADLELLNADDETLRDAAAAGRGRWASQPYSAGPVQAAVVRRFIEAGQLTAAEHYIAQSSVQSVNEFALLAAAYADNRQWGKAIQWQSRAIAKASPSQLNRLQQSMDAYQSSRLESHSRRAPAE